MWFSQKGTWKSVEVIISPEKLYYGEKALHYIHPRVLYVRFTEGFGLS